VPEELKEQQPEVLDEPDLCHQIQQTSFQSLSISNATASTHSARSGHSMLNDTEAQPAIQGSIDKCQLQKLAERRVLYVIPQILDTGSHQLMCPSADSMTDSSPI
jgi:hypothetical protein